MSSRPERGRVSIADDVSRDRLVFLLVVFVLFVFGVLMIYSSSSIMALISASCNYDPAYYAKRQVVFGFAGVVMAAIAAHVDYHWYAIGPINWVIVGAIGALLTAILTSAAGADAYGATRWISLGPVHLQPSEFAKGAIILAAAGIIQQFVEGEDSLILLAVRAVLLVLLPLLLILMEPDKGTVLVIGLTLAIMMFLAGLPLKMVLIMLGGAVMVIAVLALKDDYSSARIAIMTDPWLDEYGTGYQLVQGLYAFASGGLFGVGLGNSHQKYSYLPMAHNDFIFAVIGEELGLVGALFVLLMFFALVFLGYRIAQAAPDLCGKLIAAGSVSLLAIQLLVNVCGVLALIPLSGKPIPFLSYGGSSIMSTMILAGLVLSVARVAEASGARSGFTVHEGTSGRGLRVIEGGASTTPEGIRSSRRLEQDLGGRVSYNANGSRRIDLGPSATDRLRSRGQARGGRG